jgi:hypothetical protein
MKGVAIIALGLGIILFVAVPAARADNTSCTGILMSGPIDGNVVVPDDAICNLGAFVNGNVLVGKGASLFVGGHRGFPATLWLSSARQFSLGVG